MHKENVFPLINKSNLELLDNALNHMNMLELRKTCLFLNLPNKCNKSALIKRILNYLETGHILPAIEIPAISCAKNYPSQNLSLNSLMLYGSYKNDFKNRSFFKILVGQQFHFTAFGIDWLNERWLAGKPPTYQEFAIYWNHEYKKRILNKAKPKQEWAFIRYLQKNQELQTHKDQDTIIKEWKVLQMQQAKFAWDLIIEAKSKLAHLQTKKS